MSSVMLRGTLVSARADECEAMTGARLVVERLEHCAVGDVRDVNDHAHAVHFAHDLATEIGDAVVVLDVFVVEVAAGVAEFVGIGPSERHVARAQTVVVAQHADVALNRVAAFDCRSGKQACAGDERPGCPGC